MTAAALVGNYLIIACEKLLFAFDSTTYERMGYTDKGIKMSYGIYGMRKATDDTVLIAGQGGNLEQLSVPFFESNSSFTLNSRETIW